MNSPQDAARIINFIRRKSGDLWSRAREERPLKLFHSAAERVPAYRDFLKKNKIHHEKIKTFGDFQSVPPTSKVNYLRQYPLPMRCWDGTLKKPLVWTATSGSTGESMYFPREYRLDWESSVLHELFLLQGGSDDKEPTLVIVAFGMGVWIGGLLTYQAFKLAAERGHDLSILTTGINKMEIFKALRQIGPHFKQVILAGYPPFLKDIVDEAPLEGINLKKFRLRLLFAAEPFGEKFRDHIAKNGGVKNVFLDTLNVYGTADIGTMAYETPATILMRRRIIEKEKLFSEFFPGAKKVPTLAQYNPHFITFEAPGGDVVLTGDSAVPLIRYSVGDRGGVYSFDETLEKLARHGVSLSKEARREGIEKWIYRLPLVYVYERADFATTLYGLQIYPETVREAIMEDKLAKYLSGKLTLTTKFDKRHNQYLEIHLELRRNKKPNASVRRDALKQILSHLRFKNSEFRELHNYLKNRALPKLVFWPYGHELHFRQGVKQKWVKK